VGKNICKSEEFSLAKNKLILGKNDSKTPLSSCLLSKSQL